MVLSIKQQINVQMRCAALRLPTLHKDHPIRVAMGGAWGALAMGVPGHFPLESQVPKVPTQVSPLQIIADIAKGCSETFNVTHNECRLGDRVLDRFSTRVTFKVNAPPKKSKAFRE